MVWIILSLYNDPYDQYIYLNNIWPTHIANVQPIPPPLYDQYSYTTNYMTNLNYRDPNQDQAYDQLDCIGHMTNHMTFLSLFMYYFYVRFLRIVFKYMIQQITLFLFI